MILYRLAYVSFSASVFDNDPVSYLTAQLAFGLSKVEAHDLAIDVRS